MDTDLESLRATERECVRRFMEKARALRAENPAMLAQVARAKAATMLHVTLEKYLWCTSRLRFLGVQPLEWK
jgi:hypothetical protein